VVLGPNAVITSDTVSNTGREGRASTPVL